MSLDLDGEGRVNISTGIGFLDHMLTSLARHARLDLKLSCSGDLQVDDHHTAEDCALALGTAIDQALGDRIDLARSQLSTSQQIESVSTLGQAPHDDAVLPVGPQPRR